MQLLPRPGPRCAHGRRHHADRFPDEFRQLRHLPGHLRPGQNITSIWYTGDTATATLSGSTMASAHIAGCAAIVVSAHPAWTAAQVVSHLISNATIGVVGNPGTGSPNRLLYCVA